jgi:hypothetical protein
LTGSIKSDPNLTKTDEEPWQKINFSFKKVYPSGEIHKCILNGGSGPGRGLRSRKNK